MASTKMTYRFLGAVLRTVLATGLVAAAPALAADMTVGQMGAHPSHTQDNRALPKLACAECHAPVCSPTGVSNVVFGARATAGGSNPTWNGTAHTCSNVYCHSSNGATPVAWSWVDTSVVRPLSTECALCHGYPPSSHAATSTACNGCHPGTVKADGTIDLAGGLHINGSLDVVGGGGGGGCAGCHGYPPATGAHVAHFGVTGMEASGKYGDVGVLQDLFPAATPTTAPSTYAFGCGLCHPTDGANHRNGTVDVTLHESGSAAGSLKARALSTAAYDKVAGTCSGTYCHSTGQSDPTFKLSPAWNSGTHLGCADCHDNPPAYTSGGAATATANSHLGLAEDGYEFGHFLGIPGPTHSSKHGGAWGAGKDASAITCQTCHYETTDPANTGPSGFYYLDTSGNYALPGGDPGRITWGWQAGIQCGSCHTGAVGSPPTGTGKVLPLRHVNGKSDVVFDPRDSLPAGAWLPASPNTPAKPNWSLGANATMPWPASATWNGSTVSFGLGSATYDIATKTCTNVACHMVESPTWGRPYIYAGSVTCNACHPM